MKKWKRLTAAILSLALIALPSFAMASSTGGIGSNKASAAAETSAPTGGLGSAIKQAATATAPAATIVQPYKIPDEYLAPAWSDDTIKPLFQFVGDEYNTTVGYDMPYLVGVDTVNQVISVVKQDADGNYTVPVKYFICSTGTAKDPTPAGIHILPDSGRPEWAFFKKFNCYVRYPVHIFDDYFFHSLLYDKQDLSTRKSSSYNNLGKAVSHGCIRMYDDDMIWFSNNIMPGTIVVVYSGFFDTQLATALKARLPK